MKHMQRWRRQRQRSNKSTHAVITIRELPKEPFASGLELQQNLLEQQPCTSHSLSHSSPDVFYEVPL
jgi:hypothetical protein